MVEPKYLLESKQFYLLLAILTQLFSTTAVCQDDEANIGKASPPNASLATTSTDYSTGALNLVLPLLRPQEGFAPVPVNAIHKGTGVKVSERMGYLGLGWELDLGFKITRAIMDLPDEMIEVNGGVGWNNQSNTSLTDKIGHKVQSLIMNPNYALPPPLRLTDNDVDRDLWNVLRPLTWKLGTWEADVKKREDGSPDVYMVKLNGQSLSFIFPFPTSDIGICLNYGSQAKLNRTETGFTAIDEFGTQYIFGVPDFVRTTQYFKKFQIGDDDRPTPTDALPSNPPIPVAWNLQQIQSATSLGQSCVLQYEERIRNYTEYDDKVKIYSVIYGSGSNSVEIEKNNFITSVTEHRIRIINHSAGSVVFLYNNDGLLSEISSEYNNVSYSRTTIKYEMKTNYGYQISHVDFSDRNIIRDYIDFNYWGGNEGVNPNSYAYDAYGYYNGMNALTAKNFPINESLSKMDWLSDPSNPQRIRVLEIPNKDMDIYNENFAKFRTVKSVAYSSGLKVFYDYEINRARLSENDQSDFYCGGLRLKSVVTNNFGKYNDQEKTINYIYKTENNISSGIYYGRLVSYFLPYVNREKIMPTICYNNFDSFDRYGATIDQRLRVSAGDFEGRTCIYGKVSLVSDIDKTIMQFNVSAPRFAQSIMTAQRFTPFPQEERFESFFGGNFMSGDLRLGLLEEESKYDLNEKLIAKKKYTYYKVSEDITFTTHNVRVYYTAGDVTSISKLIESSSNCSTSDIRIHLGERDRIQFVNIPFRRRGITIASVEESAIFSDPITKTMEFKANSLRVKKVRTVSSRFETFEEFLYKDDIAFIGSTPVIPDKVFETFTALSSNTPVVTLSGQVRDGEAWVTDGKASVLLSNVFKGENIRYVSKSYGFVSSNVKRSEIPAATYSYIPGQGTVFNFGPQFILLSSKDIIDGQFVFQRDKDNFGVSAGAIYNGLVPAYSVQNVDSKSAWIDTFEGRYSSQGVDGSNTSITGTVQQNYFGSELHPFFINVVANPNAPRPRFWPMGKGNQMFMMLGGEDYVPQIEMDNDRFEEGLQLGFKIRVHENSPMPSPGEIRVKICVEDENGIELAHQWVDVDPGTDWVLAYKMLSRGSFGITYTGKMRMKAKFIIPSGYKVDIDNLCFSNADASVEFVSAVPYENKSTKENLFGKKSTVEADSERTYRIVRDLNNHIISVETQQPSKTN